MKKYVFIWFMLMLAGIFSVGCAYVCIQQSLRLSANEPAASAAKQVLVKLQNGGTPKNVLPEKTDLSTSITPFVYVYDENQRLAATSAAYGNEDITYPKSVLSEIDKRGESRVTWQPKLGLRFATVGMKYSGGYIIGCYSLSESENTISRIGSLLLMGYALYAVGCAVLLWIIAVFRKAYPNKVRS